MMPTSKIKENWRALLIISCTYRILYMFKALCKQISEITIWSHQGIPPAPRASTVGCCTWSTGTALAPFLPKMGFPALFGCLPTRGAFVFSLSHFPHLFLSILSFSWPLQLMAHTFPEIPSKSLYVPSTGISLLMAQPLVVFMATLVPSVITQMNFYWAQVSKSVPMAEGPEQQWYSPAAAGEETGNANPEIQTVHWISSL